MLRIPNSNIDITLNGVNGQNFGGMRLGRLDTPWELAILAGVVVH